MTYDPDHKVMYVHVDGTLQKRFVDYIDVTDNFKAYPVLFKGESLVWRIGSDVPIIIKEQI